MNLTKMSDLAAVQDQTQVGPPVRLRHEPALLGRAEGLRDHLSAEAAHRARRLRRPDGPGPPGQGDRPGRALLDPAGDRPVRLRLLDDDKNTQPAENIAPIVRDDYLAKVDAAAFKALLDAASAKVTTEALTTMGVDVAVNHKDVDDVAKAFLTAAGPAE